MNVKQFAMPRRQGGALLIEILVTIIIVVIGAMGLMQMQARLQKSEVESYQRTQAMILLSDMASRISANRGDAANYVTTGLDPAFLGGLSAELDCSTLNTGTPTLQENDFAQWCDALQGAAETQSGASVGAMIGGRGCVQPNGADEYLVTVAWQGMTPVDAPDNIANPVTIKCGEDLYDHGPPECVDNLCRRYVTTLVSLARLDT